MSRYIDDIETDSDGDASIELSSGEYEFDISADDHIGDTETVVITEDTDLEYSLTAIDRGPVPPVRHIDILETNSDGDASIELSSGEYEFDISADGFDDESETVVITEDTDLDFELTETDPDPEPPVIGDETVTDAAGEFELFLDDGEFEFLADHSEYWAEYTSVEIDGEDKEFDVELEQYGDRIDTSDLTELDSITTDGDGEGYFDEVPSGEYVVEFEHTDYRTKTRTADHAYGTELDVELQALDVVDPPDIGRPPPAIGSAQGFAPVLSIPDGPAHFECAVLDTDAGENFEIPVLVTNAGGERGATDLRMETTSSAGGVIATQDITLDAAGVTIAHLPVRSFIEQASLPASVTVSTIDDTESFALTASVAPRPVVNPGRPTRLSETSTVGGANPFTTGPIREPAGDTASDFPADGWAITLEQPNGDQRVIPDLLDDPDIEDTHTELSTWSAEVPADPGLNEWDYQTRAYITRDGRLVNIGWVDTVESDAGDQITTLSGSGPLADLTGDEHEIEIVQNLDWRAADRIINEVAPDWDITVVQSDDPVMVYDEDYSGDGLDILTSFCEDYGLFLRPSQTHFGEATIYAPGRITATAEFALLDYQESSTSEGYANRVVYRGDDVSVTVPADDEIRRLADERDLRISDARETITITDDDVTSERKAESKAQAELRERIARLEVGGSMTVPARRMLPGVAYSLPTDDDVWHGARSIWLRGDGYVEIPPEIFDRMQYSGAVAIGFKGDFSDLATEEFRLFGVTGDGQTWLTTQEETLGFAIRTGDEFLYLSAFDERPEDDTWHLFHGDYTYDPGADETTYRAGHDGDIVQTSTIDGAFTTEHVENAWIGRRAQDWAREIHIDSARFFDAPQSAERYGALSRGESIPATDLVSRFDFEESTTEDTAYDTIGGYHGTREEDVWPGGRPAILQSADHTVTETDADFQRQVTLVDALRDLKD